MVQADFQKKGAFVVFIIVLGVVAVFMHKYLGSSASLPTEIELIYEEFVAEAAIRGKVFGRPQWRFRFDRLAGLKVGRCRTSIFGKTIVLDSVKWRGLDLVQKKAVLIHEFGHCILNRSHLNATLSGGECLSLMDGREGGFFC